MRARPLGRVELRWRREMTRDEWTRGRRRPSEWPQPFIEAVDGRQKPAAVAEVVRSELRGDVALRLVRSGERPVLRLNAPYRSRDCIRRHPDANWERPII